MSCLVMPLMKDVGDFLEIPAKTMEQSLVMSVVVEIVVIEVTEEVVAVDVVCDFVVIWAPLELLVGHGRQD